MPQSPVLDNFKIRIAIDTQILAYLVDKTYPTLNSFFKLLSTCPFVDVVCSRYVNYEFIGIRKYEHYLRAIHSFTNAKGGTMSFGSALKYKNDWTAPELKYEDTYEDVSKKVEEDLRDIDSNFGVQYHEHLYSQLWGPHQNLVLSSKISKEDALVLLSSIFSSEQSKEDHLIFLTNDDKFYRAIMGDLKMPSLDDVFEKHNINCPVIHKIANIRTPTSDIKLDLLHDEKTEEELQQYIVTFLKEHILIKNQSLYLGKVTSCSAKWQGKLLCFQLLNGVLNQDIYLSILDKDLKQIYSHEIKLKDFYNNEAIQNYPYSANDNNDDSKNISIELKDVNGEYLKKELYDIIAATGNFVFIHPDTFI